jgi:hypothetical protein
MNNTPADKGADSPMPGSNAVDEFMEYLGAMQRLLDPAAIDGRDKSKQGALFAFWLGGMRALVGAQGLEPSHVHALAMTIFQRILPDRSAEHVTSLVEFWAGSFQPESQWCKFADAGSVEFMDWRAQPRDYRFPKLVSLFGGPPDPSRRPQMTVGNCYAMLDNLIGQMQADPRLAEQLREDPTRRRRLIDYGHIVDGVLYHGTVDDLNGHALSTWTYESGGRVVRRDQPITQEEFIRLWGGIAILPVFPRWLTSDMAKPIDLEAEHVVGIVWTENGQYKRSCFLVPVDEPAPEFAEWLRILNVPHPRVRVLLQPLAALLMAREKEKGAPLTQEEVLAVRNSTPCKVMSPMQAAQFNESLHKQHHLPFIDPHDCWQQWQTVRQSLQETRPEN